MVATCVCVGSLVPGGGLPAGRFCTYRSSLSLLGGGKGEGEGELTARWGPCGGPVPPPPVAPTAGNRERGGSGGLDGGMADRLCLRAAGMGASWIGLWRIGHLGKGGGAVADAALVLGNLAGLRQSCSGSGEGALSLGDPGRGIRVAIHRISSLARRNSSSTLLIFC